MVIQKKKQMHQPPERQVDDNVMLAAYSTSFMPSLVGDLKFTKVYSFSSNATPRLTLVRQAILGHSDIFLPRVLTLMLVMMHLRGDLVRICEVRIVLQTIKRALAWLKERNASDYCSAVSRTTPRNTRLWVWTRLSEKWHTSLLRPSPTKQSCSARRHARHS